MINKKVVWTNLFGREGTTNGAGLLLTERLGLKLGILDLLTEAGLSSLVDHSQNTGNVLAGNLDLAKLGGCTVGNLGNTELQNEYKISHS